MVSFLSVFHIFLCFTSCCQLIVLSHAGEQQKTSPGLYVVEVSSLLPQKEVNCKPFIQGKRQGVSLEVMHRHGPCSRISNVNTTSNLEYYSELLRFDQERVNYIHAKLSGQSMGLQETKSVTLPAKSGLSIGSGNYIVSVGLGSPKNNLALIFDTGSDLTWIQCKPCMKMESTCYQQVDPIFDPSSSSSYANISCASSMCNDLVTATGFEPGCLSSTCIYTIRYGDGSNSTGFFAKERLTLTSTDYIDGYLFGCGEDNQGLFRGAAGLIGLGQDKLSLVSQGATKYGNYFSYCLPTTSSSQRTGHLTLGRGGTLATKFSYTPLVKRSTGTLASLYFLDLEHIYVGGRQLSISPTVFSSAGTIIDSGTVVSRLPPKAYAALRSAFKQYLSKYPSAPPVSIFDTCYDFTNYQTVSIPKVSLSFSGGAVMDLSPSGILLGSNISQVCLAFAGNSRDTSVGILGNSQQQTFDVVYDVDGGKIGFGPNGC